MSTKDDLMSSLMGGGGGDEDLFGAIPDVAEPTPAKPLVQHDPTPASLPPPAATMLPPATGIPPSSVPGDALLSPTAPVPLVPAAPAPLAAPAASSSILSSSGLLGTPPAMNGGGGGGGGLFDAIDEEEEEKKKEEERQQAEEQQRVQEARRKEEEQRLLMEQQQQQQQLQDQMQSIHLGPAPSAYPPNGSSMMLQQPPPATNGMMRGGEGSFMQPQPQQSYMQQSMQQSMQGSYMQQQEPMQQQQQQPMIHSQPPVQGSYVNQSPVAVPPPQASMMQQQQQTSQQPNPNTFYRNNNNTYPQAPPNNGGGSRFYQSPVRGSVTAGMHGPGGTGGHATTLLQQQQQQPPPQYTKITVLEPLLLGSPTVFGIGQPPHWSYHVATQLQDGTVWAVRRRFRHVVALEDRMREECPGAILPPRPDKHATRAIEEASAHQSAEFAVQRAAELQYYLNQMIQHPYASTSIVLRLFLSLQDDLGIAWPEVSTNALTRITNASVGAAVKVSEKTMNDTAGGEDNAELLALQNAESIRMGAVLQAVPKLEGAVTLLREQAELLLAVGMEFSRVAKEVAEAQPLDICSSGLLRSGRRSKRMVMELSAALQSYSHHYKLCRYERMAFSDRRAAIARRHKERHRADQRASQLMVQQHHQRMAASNAVLMDELATDAGQECEEIGQRLKSEVHRIAHSRRGEWSASVKIVASAMKEALTERVAIWETVQENFLQAFPEYKTAAAAQPPMAQQQMPPMAQQQQHQMEQPPVVHP